ncbi:transposase, partial [Vibrio mimicus]
AGILAEWQHYYNWERPHSSLKGLTPIDKVTEISAQTPLSEEVSQHYEIKKERFQEQNYKLDLQLRNLKPSL